jgi:hypothetical protein
MFARPRILPSVRGLIAAADPVPEPTNSTRALITSAAKRQNKDNTPATAKAPVPCLATGCNTLTPPHLRLCRIHYHECIAGKHPSLPLKTGDSAHYDASTQKIVFPHLATGAATTKPGRKPGRGDPKSVVRSFIATPV